MKNYLLILLLSTAAVACKQPVALDLTDAALIPAPVKVVATNASFEINHKTKLQYTQAELLGVGNYLQKQLEEATGMLLPVSQTGKTQIKNSLLISIDPLLDSMGNEGYELKINPKNIQLTSATAEGIFRGIQTFRQLLPPAREMANETPVLIASGTISDYPEYVYRGTMLDVARHFFSVEDVKKHIDNISLYKINTLHLHLADDQGWRLEIKSWPKLTTIGGSTEVGGGEGGYYTQEEYKDLVEYAAQHFITIVPEIDMPGHTNAALASYAELNCDGIARELYTGTNVGFSTLCTDKEVTYKFVDEVLGEISELTPGPYLHIGGDESHVTPLKKYIPFINRVKTIVAKHGKTMVGWDEIAHARLDSTDIVQFWSNDKNTRMGIEKGAKVIVSPAQRAYLDMKYDSTTQLGLNWAAYIEVDDAYTWDPANYAKGMERENILGIESPLWAETIETIDDIEFLVFPRICAHAEIGWSGGGVHTWEDFSKRLAQHGKLLKAHDIDFYRSPKVNWD